MRHFEFSRDVLAEIERDRFRHPDPLVQQRMEVLWLKAHSETHMRIAELAGLGRATVQRILDQYEAGGLESVRTFHWHVPTSELAPYQQLLEAEFRQRPPHTVAEACQRIEQLTGCGAGRRGSASFCVKRWGCVGGKWRRFPFRPSRRSPNTPPRRRPFLKTELEPRLDEARSGQRAVFFVDAAHFVLASFLGWLWCKTRLFVKAASGRQRYNVLGAFNAVSHELVRVTNTSYITAETVCQLLRKIAALDLATPITLVLDNARYQRCQLVQDLAGALNIELLFLPSYSPNLNLIERLWKFVKKAALNSRYHGSFAEFQGVIDQCLNELPTTHRPQISTLRSTAFQTFGNVSMLPA